MVVCVANDITGKDEEEVNSKVAVIEMLVHRVIGESLAQVEYYHHQGRYSTKSVEYLVAWFGSVGVHRIGMVPWGGKGVSEICKFRKSPL